MSPWSLSLFPTYAHNSFPLPKQTTHIAFIYVSKSKQIQQYQQMDFLCGLFKHQVCQILLFPPSETEQNFQSWANPSNMQQSGDKQNKSMQGFARIGLNYGPVQRTFSYDYSYSSSQPSIPTSIHKTYSLEYKQLCFPTHKTILKSQIPSVIKERQSVKDSKGSEKQSVVRMIKRSEINDQHITKWIDKDFKKENFYQKHPLFWKRVDQYFQDEKYNFITNPISLFNVQQGIVGDCYFLSSIAALTNPKMPQRTLRLFPQIKVNQKGFYKSRLMLKGILQEVVVDDMFPSYINKYGHLELLGCRPYSKHKQIYTMVLEKCWAKLCGSYQNINGGLSSVALHALSGALTKDYILAKKTSNKKDQQHLFEKISKFCANKYAMCAGTQKSSIADIYIQTSHFSIIIPASHIYCVVGIQKQPKMVKIYNPWGLNQQNNSGFSIGGQFKISWDLFKKCFHHLTVCKIHDNAHYLYSEMVFKPNDTKFIELTIEERKTGYFAISVCQTYQKNTNHKYLNVNFIVLKYLTGGQFQLITIRSKDYSDHYLELHDLSQGRYLIAIYISDKEIKEKLTFGVYSEDSFGFVQKEFDRDFSDNFLSRILLKYDSIVRKREDKILSKVNPRKGNVWISASLVGISRIGYIILNVDKTQKEEYELQLCSQPFQFFGLTVLHPYHTKIFKLTAKPGFSSVAIIIISDITKYAKGNFKDNREFFKKISKGPQKFWNSQEN